MPLGGYEIISASSGGLLDKSNFEDRQNKKEVI